MKFVMFPTENLVKKVMGKKKKRRKERRIRNLLAASHTADEVSRFTRLKPWKTVECGTSSSPEPAGPARWRSWHPDGTHETF